jgi:hypothetical protein
MPFTLLEKPRSGRRSAVPTPNVKMRRMAGKATFIVFSSPLLAELNWIKGDHVEVLVGTGKDAGTIAIRRAANGYKLSAEGASMNALRISARQLIPGASVKTVTAQHEIVNGALYIRVPAAFLTSPDSFASIISNAMVAA